MLQIIKKIILLPVFASLAFGVSFAAHASDITRKDMVNAIITYERAARDKESSAQTSEMLLKPPQLDKTLRAGKEVVQGHQRAEVLRKQGIVKALSQALFPMEKTADELAEEQEHLEESDGDASDVSETDEGETRALLPFLAQHMLFYCSPREQQVVAGCGPSLLPNGDVTIGSLLDVETMASPLHLKAAQTVIKNITNPMPYPIARVERDEDGEIQPVDFGKKSLKDQENIADMYAKRASTSVAMHSFYQMYSMRVPNPELDDQSPMSLMKKEALRRFNDPNWVAELSTLPREALLRELAVMDAFKIYMSYMQYRQNERIEALLASMLSGQIEFSMKMMSSASKASQ